MRTLFACKDTKAFCPYCSAHLFTFIKDIYQDDFAQICDVTFASGQAPDHDRDLMQCKKCFMLYGPGSIILEIPTTKDLK